MRNSSVKIIAYASLIFSLIAMHTMPCMGDTTNSVTSLHITSQPRSLTNMLGSTAIYTVMVEGVSPLIFEWSKDGTSIAGATNDVLTITNVEFADSGTYLVTVSNVYGSIISSNAELTVRWPQAGDVDSSFNPGSGINGSVRAVAVQTDGKVLIAGQFTAVHGAVRGYVARLNKDGSTDHTFMNGMSCANGMVYSLVIQHDGKVLIGGSFSNINGSGRNRIARLNKDGSLDATFLNGMSGLDDTVYSLAVQSDGKVLVGGLFKRANDVYRSRIARLNADGSLDVTFLNGLSGVNNTINSIAIQSDGKVLIGGDFNNVNGVNRNRFARLNSDGHVDMTFLDGMDGANNTVNSFAVQPDGKVLITGRFTIINGAARSRIARLNADGSLDTTFLDALSGADNNVFSIALESDGKLLIGGSFGSVNGAVRNRVARLNENGSLDVIFLDGLSGADNNVYYVATQPDGMSLIGGYFTSVNGISRCYIARLNADGGLDAPFLSKISGADSFIRSLAVQSDGKVLIGGWFSNVNGVRRNRVARLNPDGSLDETFMDSMSGANSTINCLAIQSDAKVLIGGYFNSVNGMNRGGIARLNPDGSLDETFQNGMSGVDGYVRSLAIQSDGKVLIGGYFTNVNGVGRNRIARLNPDGSLDQTFQNGMSGASVDVYSIAVQPDGKILIGGDFSRVNGSNRNRIARLNPDGSLDTTFLNGMNGANNTVYCFAVQPDRHVLVGGDFGSVNGLSRNRIARINADGSLDAAFLNGMSGVNGTVYTVAIQTDGKVLVGGDFSSVNGLNRSRIARLNSDGSIDAAFQNGMSGADNLVYSLALQPGGNVLIGGRFGNVNGVPSSCVARLKDEGTLPLIARQSPSVICNIGQPASFSVDASGQAPLYYQWYKNGFTISNSCTAQLTLHDVQPSNAGNYYCTVTNSYGSATSLVVVLTVVDPMVLQQALDDTNLLWTAGGNSIWFLQNINTHDGVDAMQSGAIRDGQEAWLETTVVGPGGLSFWWCVSSETGSDFLEFYINGIRQSERISGTVTWRQENYTLSKGVQVLRWRYTKDSVGSFGQDKGWLDQVHYFSQSGSPAIQMHPQGGTFNSGAAVTMNVTAWGEDPLYYQWLLNGSVILNETSSSLFYSKATGTQAGNYFCVISNSSGSVTSEVAVLAVVDPFIKNQPRSTTNTFGSTAIIAVAVEGASPLSYQWSKDGIAISGATNDVFMIRDVQFTDSGHYSVTVSNEYGSTTCSNAVLSVRWRQEGDVDWSFNPGSGVAGDLNAVAVQPDGKVLIAGQFTSVHGIWREHVARLNSDGSIDHTFMNGMSGASATVNCLAIQPDGKVLIGGSFVFVNGVNRNCIARLNTDGSTDSNFQDGMGGASSTVVSLAIQSDGKVLIGGGFIVVNGVRRNHIARLNADGSLDTTFLNGMSGADDSINSITIQPDGKVLIGGWFGTFNDVSRGRIARLNSDGSLDMTFQNSMSGVSADGYFTAIYSIVAQPDGKVLVGGEFSSVNDVHRSRIARLNADGSLDMTFLNAMAGADNSVGSVAIQPDGKILIAGVFSSINGMSRNYIARLNTDGSLDTTFLNCLSGADNFVRTIAVQPEGKVLIGGSFTSVNGVSSFYIAQLWGTVDNAVISSRFSGLLKTGGLWSWSMSGTPGLTYQVQCADELTFNTQWRPLTNVTLIVNPTVFTDRREPQASNRFYRATILNLNASGEQKITK